MNVGFREPTSVVELDNAFVVILDKSGKVLGQAGYQKAEVKEYITMLNKFVK